MDIPAIREALAQAVQDVAGADWNVYAYLPATPRTPLIAVIPADEYRSPRETFDDEPSYTLQFDLAVGSTARAQDAFRLIDEMLSTNYPNSLEPALDASGRLGGLVDDIHIGAASTFATGPETAPIFTATLRVTVYARRDP
jgi:hypothetical protein